MPMTIGRSVWADRQAEQPNERPMSSRCYQAYASGAAPPGPGKMVSRRARAS